MSRRHILFQALLVLAFTAGLGAVPAPSPAAARYAIDVLVLRQGPSLVITLTGSAPPSGAWVGCSLYTRGEPHVAWVGRHLVQHETGTRYQASWLVPASTMVGGNYEVTLWSTRVPGTACRIPGDPWCHRNGFHMEGLLAYRNGTLVPTPGR